VAVEKLTHRKIVEKTLQQEALRTAISVLLDIFYVPNFSYFGKTGVFQQQGARPVVGAKRKGTCLGRAISAS